MNSGLAGKVVIVTGGGSNIGRGISLGFAKEGSKVVIADIDEPQANKTAKLVKEAGAQEVLVIKTDVTKPPEVEAMVSKTLAEFQRIDVLVNNAGGKVKEGPMLEKSWEQFDIEYALNFYSAVVCTMLVVPQMKKQNHGRIINITTDASLLALDLRAFYAGCKAGVTVMSQSLGKELGRYGITVNVVSPGVIPPQSEEDLGQESSWNPASGISARPMIPGWQERASTMNPMRRLGTPRDMANAVLFFAAESSDYINGQILSVSGGYTTFK